MDSRIEGPTRPTTQASLRGHRKRRRESWNLPRTPARTSHPDGLDWDRFRDLYYPDSRRHNFEAIVAQGDYRGTSRRQSGSEAAPLKEAVSTDAESLGEWENEGGVSPDIRKESRAMISDPAQGFTGAESREGRMYEDDRTKRLHRRRLVGYGLCIALWLISAIPLARLSSDDGGGAGVAAAYLAAGLAVALVIRGVYMLTRRRPFWSPWLFVIAAILAIMSYGIQSAGDEPFRPAAASEGAESR